MMDWRRAMLSLPLLAACGQATPDDQSTAVVAAGGVSSAPHAGAYQGGNSGEAPVPLGGGPAGTNGQAAGAGGAAGSGSGASAGAASSSGGGGAAGALPSAGSGGSDPLEPPEPDTASQLPVANPGPDYIVEGNLPYGPHPRQRLDVMYPKGAGPTGTKTLPGVIMFHGGGWIQGDKATMSSFYSRFLRHGFLVCSVEYRVADGTTNGASAPAAVEDALLAARWFWSYLDYYHVDRARYVVTGASAGGHLALMVGMATPAAMLGPTHPADFKIAAIVNGYGPTDVSDLLQRGTSFAHQWLPSTTPDRAAQAVRLSPITYARKDLPPLITVHGSQDSTVPTAQAEALDAKLQAVGADTELHRVAGAAHGFTTPSTAWPAAEQAIFGFLTAHGL